MKQLTYILILSTIIFSACSGNKKQLETSVINGELTHSIPAKLIYLYEMTPQKNVLLDSFAIKDSKFLFTLHNKLPGFYNITIDKNNFVTLLVDTNETITYKGDLNRLYYNYTVIGSKGSSLLKEFNDNRQKVLLKIDSLKKVIDKKMYADNYASIKPTIDSAFEKMFISEKKYAEAFINKNTTSLASIIALYQPIGIKYLFDADKDYAIFIKVDSVLSKRYPGSIHIQSMHKQVEKSLATRKQVMENIAKLQPGKYAPDMVLPDLEGNPKKLSNYKENPVILYFWAGWSKGSRSQNAEMIDLFKQYKKKGLTVYAISLDRSKAEWKAAVEDDKLKWTNVSGQGSLDSEIAKTYNVREIPSFFLLDTANIIVNRYTSANKLSIAVDSLMKKY